MSLIDISHMLDGDTLVYPGDEKTTLSLCRELEKDCYNAYFLQTGLHTGTHIDVPMHLIADDKTAADFPLERFAGRGVLLDARGENPIAMKPEYTELVGEGDVVLLFTGHDVFYSQADQGKYFSEHPTVSDELAAFLLSRKIKMLGMDMPSPDYPPFTFHKDLLRSGIMLLENLTNLKELAGVKNFIVMALPLKIKAEASLVRAVCVTNE